MIELKNIHKSYGNKAIIQNLDLIIKDNELTCLLGSSGSGKSTILRIIAGLEAAQGDVTIDNKLMNHNNEILIPPHKRNLGFIFQDLALWPHFTVFDNIAFGLKEQKKISTEQIHDKVMEVLSFFDLQEHSDKYPNQLSGGQQQLVAISRSLVLEPKILLMDEPLANLDVKLKRKILDLIKKLKSEFNLTIVYVTHDHKEAFAIADNIIILNKGNIEAIGNVDEIKNSENEFTKYFLEY